LAHAFAGAGAKVALVARSGDALEALTAALGGTAHVADLSDPAQVAALIERVEDEAGPIDVLVNNAGVGIGGDFATASAESLRHVTQVNF
jgi:NADP-dependent 3-hydroxy acid dehydrogenase YdfG